MLRSQRGQGLVEYLLLVALMAVATIGIIRVLNHTVRAQFARVTNTLQGRTGEVEFERVEKSDYRKKDMSDFMSGAVSPNRSTRSHAE